MHKIQEHQRVTWHHVPTEDNPADVGRRGGDAACNSLWKQGAAWLSDISKWPTGIILKPSTETLAEAKVKREIVSLSVVPTKDALDHVLNSHQLLRILRIDAWVWRMVGKSV